MTAEQKRLEEARQQKVLWKKWGPDLSERQWGTVREDYSEGGDAWNFFRGKVGKVRCLLTRMACYAWNCKEDDAEAVRALLEDLTFRRSTVEPKPEPLFDGPKKRK